MSPLVALVASIPSPPSGGLGIGPLRLNAYGLAIAVGALLAVELVRRRWVATGGSPNDVQAIAWWAIPAGLLGARAYHVVTDWHRFDDAPLDVVKIWEGGLGIPGGILAGVVAGVVVARRRGLDVAALLDAAAPGLPLAQAVGRLGNWFNQELFGRPTDLPWGLEIDPANRPAAYVDVATFHPTFLYEALWNLALCAALIAIGRRAGLRKGPLFVLYVGGYGLGRLWVEALRIDEATTIAGLRVNTWVSGLMVLGAAVTFVLRRRRGVRPDAPADPTTEPTSADATGPI